MVNPDGGVCDLYLQGGHLVEKLGTSDPVVIAEDVSALEFTYYRTKAGKRTVTADPAQVTELKIDLTLGRGGFTRTGTLLVTIRNRPR
jgi:hypothetical protein